MTFTTRLMTLVGTALLTTPLVASAAVYTCVDGTGHRRTSDRPIPECLDREQSVMDKNGIKRKVIPPNYTATERERLNQEKLQQDKIKAAQDDLVRRDRMMVKRYPDEAAHNKAREAALDNVRQSIASSKRRIDELLKDKEPIMAEGEFYKNKTWPYKLRSKLEQVDVAIAAQENAIENQKAEEKRINENFDMELKRLRRLWAGAPAGFADGSTSAPNQPVSGSAAPSKVAPLNTATVKKNLTAP